MAERSTPNKVGRHHVNATCLLCEESIVLILHKTRRQIHGLCQSCAVGYICPILEQKQKKRDYTLYIPCCGSIQGLERNRCKQHINLLLFLTIIPNQQQLKPLQIHIEKIVLLSEPNSRRCPHCEEIFFTTDTNCTCPKCNNTWCNICGIYPYHIDSNKCPQRLEYMYKDSPEILQQFKDGKMKECPTCRHACAKIDGCNKMMCPNCETQFCWLCLEKDIDYSRHFNSDLAQGSCKGRLWE